MAEQRNQTPAGDNTQWTTIIRPRTGWFDVDLEELWRYRDLIVMFVKRNFTVMYKQTILGPLWIILNPLITTVLFNVVFGGIAGLSTDGTPSFLFYMAGNTVWTFFASCINGTANTFVANSQVFGKVYFPRLTTPISQVLTSLINFFIQFVMYILFWVYFAVTGSGVHLTAWAFAVPLVVLEVMLLGLGVGIIVSALTTKYRDLAIAVSFGVQLWMYISPVVYPLSSLEESPRLQMLMRLNPMTAPIEVFRMGTLGTGTVEVGSLIYSLIVTAAALVLGVVLFSRIEKTFMDTVEGGAQMENQTHEQNQRVTVIQVSGLKKQYKLGQIGGGTLTHDLQSWWARVRGKEDPNTVIGTDARLFGKTFMALNGVDLTVYKGEALGIIGRNGAGKSTLLKILSRITAPTEGEIRLRGRVASMLEVGTGFNNEMTGRENIYMNGAILGMTRAEVDSKIDQIIEFSECGDFIDTPVKRYSSGMFVKLAFAVAAHLDSEIMVMDEVLAVGDMKFQQKCLGKMSDVAGQEGRTVLYVSHNMSTIRQLCTRCVVLDQGRVIFDGDVEQAIAVYMETTDVNVVHYDLLDVSRMNASAGKRMRLETLDFVGKESSVFADTEKIRVRITWRVSEPFAGVHLKLNLHFRDSTPVGITHPVNLGAAVPGKLYTTEFEFDPSLLGEGQYFFYVDVFDGVLTQAVCLDKPVTEFAFEVTSGDLTMPEWAPGWGRIHFPPVKVLENGYDG